MHINDSVMRNTCRVQTQKVRVLSEDDAGFLHGKREMFLIRGWM
jgi:hypothetical protein